MIRRNTWILLAVFLVGLAGVIWFNTQESGIDSMDQLEATVEPLWLLEEANIRELILEDLQTGRRVRAQRAAEIGWLLLEPESELADIARIERAVTSLQLIQPVDRLQTQDYSQYGLDQPRYQVVLSMVDDSNRGIMIGRQAPTGDVYYARVGQTGQVLLVRSGSIQSAIDLLTDPPVITATPELTDTPSPEGG